ncbi:AI-2E family transporter [Humisphaera borealis]|uniref:AI-2E family transporter n=1 Tax=Humisphaera borealis TaxID=2807512 RepID=A0A7M2WXB0_9BACT|nr:AI-2E family transporter [Humisphaera borealis]QOV89451.1 AI-2E family transporter [Humisphaera borealis]
MNTGSTRQIERFARLALVGALIVGCWLVLRFFFDAILFAIVIAISTRPAFKWLNNRLKGRRTLSSLLCCVGVVLALVGPASLLAVSAADAGTTLLDQVRTRLSAGPIEPPSWIPGIPLIGPSIADNWRNLAGSRMELVRALQSIAAPFRDAAINAGGVFAAGVVQLVIAVFLLFFLYRDGEKMSVRFERAFERVAGPDAAELIGIAQNTVRSVMLGMVGTAVAQSVVATVGFAIAGVPGALLLGAATFVTSPVPFGPPLVWGGAAIWLYANGDTGWAIFMVIYGAVVISSVDNILKPLLISRGSGLTLAPTLLGVLGGVIAFGFMGLFIGPTVIALAINLGKKWLDQHSDEPDSLPSAADPALPPAEQSSSG